MRFPKACLAVHLASSQLTSLDAGLGVAADYVVSCSDGCLKTGIVYVDIHCIKMTLLNVLLGMGE